MILFSPQFIFILFCYLLLFLCSLQHNCTGERFDWGSSTLDISTAGIAGISCCLYGFVYCTVFILAVLTDRWWKLSATYCNNTRYWHNPVDRHSAVYTLQNAGQEHSKHQSDRGQQISSLSHMVPDVPAVCLLQIGVLSCHAQGSVDR